MQFNLYKNPSRFLGTETDDIILNAKILKGPRLFKTVLKKSVAGEMHDQTLQLTPELQGPGYSEKGGDTDPKQVHSLEAGLLMCARLACN